VRDVPAAEAGPRRFSALHNRNFALLWSGQIVSNSGSWMQIVAQGWLVYQITNSPFALGAVSMARAVPMIVLPFFGGTVADRVARLRLLKVTQTLSFLVALPLGFLVAFGVVQVWEVALIGFLSGAVNAFDQPTRQALLPDLVQRADLTNAIALNSASWQGSAMIGPAAAGLAIATLGLATAFFINAFSYLAVVAALFMMRGVPERVERSRRTGLAEDVLGGLRYVGTTRFVLTLILLTVVANVFGRSYQQFLPVFARDALGQGGGGLGLMTSATGVGTMVAAVAVAAMGDVGRKGMIMVVSMTAFAGCLLLFTMTHSFPIAVLLLFGVGVTNFTLSTMTITMLQLFVPGEVRGRVLSLVTIAAQGLSPLGALFIGSAAEWIGTPESVAWGAVIVAASAAVAGFGVPSVRRFAGVPPELATAAG
jgi:MFS family permease